MKLGSALREKREARELSIADVAAEIKISKKYIQALEEGNFLLIPSQVYAKGFLKAYAEFLGLDPNPLVGELMGYYKRIEEGRKSTQAAPKITRIVPFPRDLKLPKMPVIPKCKFNAKTMFILVISVFFLLFILSAYGYIKSYQKMSIQVKANPPAPENIEPAKVLPKAAAPAVTAAPVPKGRIEVRVETTKRSWVSVSSGTKQLYSQTLEAGARLRFVGREITVKAGNGGGVKIYVNGESLGVMGVEGAVAEKTYRAPQ